MEKFQRIFQLLQVRFGIRIDASGIHGDALLRLMGARCGIDLAQAGALMKIFRVKQIVALAAAIGAFAAWTPAASDNSTVHIDLSAILSCDGSASGSIISNGSRLQGTTPCQATGSLPADGSSGPGIGATSIGTPDGALLLSFEGREVEVVVFVCPVN